MSQRHRNQDVAPPPKMELRAHAHNERHRIHSELQAVAAQVSAGLRPRRRARAGPAWKPAHHHDAEVAKEQAAKRNRATRHWKMKMWKRRTHGPPGARRRQLRLAADEPESASASGRQPSTGRQSQAGASSSRRSCHSSTVMP